MKIEDLLIPKEFVSIDQDIRFEKDLFKKVIQILNFTKNTYAPNNSDPFRFIVIKDKTLKQDVANATLRELILSKVMVIMDCNTKEAEIFGINSDSILCNCGMALQNLIIYSRVIGLEPAIFFNFNSDKFKDKMKLRKPLAVICFGNIHNKKQEKVSKTIITYNDTKNTKLNPLLEDAKLDEYIKQNFKDTTVDIKSLALSLKKNIQKIKKEFLNKFN